ncbi:SusC/RagA family TonB-linked outer membrane protein [Mongoliibacter ruber]|uniref:TonB-linked SusC/RagA family outer membrane protein n=1 Tax=Mongoliibacter ruber TaxID=1750599 RepID=A0A2T0WVG0_9BACT|nr:TonB-dependent receptor [Mongoliibacter ruber]PRY90682.1 TonB-linked SusC/RagA family outer membrane protein [Mongoliibacter ruber]
MKRIITTIFASMLFPLLFGSFLFAENDTNKNSSLQFSVSGIVVSGEDNEPMPGVNITEKGTSNGTVTDIDGRFSLTVANQSSVLVFSFIGFEKQEIQVGTRATINVTLNPDLSQLNEVVVVGYGTVNRSDLTGSVSSISEKDLQLGVNASLDQMMQGRAPGVQVIQASSAPGGGVAVRIRGGNSISGGNEPLYVIDGFPIYNSGNEVNPGGGQFNEFRVAPNPLASINPNDIESMEILKDASATAIYGSRGANGVVIITTKRGKAGKGEVSFDVYRGIQTVDRKIDVLDAPGFMRGVNESAAIQNRVPAGESVGSWPFSQEEINNPEYNTNWQDEIFRSAPVSNYQIGFNGGTENMVYAISANYFSQDGVIRESGFDRYSMRVNLDGKVNNWLKIGNSLTLSRSINNQIFDGGSGNANASAVHASLNYLPILPVFNSQTGLYSQRADANRAGFSPFDRRNPVQLINETTDNTIADRVLGNIFADATIAKGLTYRILLGIDSEARRRNFYFSNNLDPLNRASNTSIGTVNAFTWLNTHQLNYEMQVGKHRLNLTGVYEIQRRAVDRTFMGRSQFDNNVTKFYSIQAGNDVPGVSSGRNEWSLASYMLRANYVFNNKYLMTVTARADGSSKFGSDNRWAFFPSVAFAWRASEEQFIQNLNVFSDLKVRASAGQIGNQEIGSYNSLPNFALQKYSFGGVPVNAYSMTRLANPGLRWETTTQADLGADMGFFNDRVTFSVDLYYKRTTDLLMNFEIPIESGFGSVLGNIGSVENKGLELALGGHIVNSRRIKWYSDINYSINRNMVLDLGGTEQIRGPRISYDYGSAFASGSYVRVGQPLGVFWGAIYDGVYQNQEQIDAHGVTYNNGIVPTIGSGRYRDVAGPPDENGNLTGPDGIVDQNDLTVIGDPNPDFIFGWTNRISIGNFELTTLLQGVIGGDVLNVNKRDLYGDAVAFNLSTDRLENAWRESNPNAIYPMLHPTIGLVNNTPGGGISSIFVEDGSFVRLRNIMLAYNLPVTSKIFKGGQVYVSGQNILTFTRYSGFNPEVNQAGQNNINQGIDFGSYPMARTYMIGMNLRF